jgi:hypothetical protein
MSSSKNEVDTAEEMVLFLFCICLTGRFGRTGWTDTARGEEAPPDGLSDTGTSLYGH